MSQLELFTNTVSPERLTVQDIFIVLWKNHLGEKPSGRTYNSNRKAICHNLGGYYYDTLTEPDVARHLALRVRDGVGPQTIRHDIGLLTILFNQTKKWHRRGYVLDGIDFTKLRLPGENPVGDIKKPKAPPRQVVISPNDFSKWIEHCEEPLKIRSYFAMDTGLSPIDLKALKPSNYNAHNDCLDVQRHKTGKFASLPVSDRCRTFILKAIEDKREFVIDWKNHHRQFMRARKASGVYFWFGRDIRKTYANAIDELANYNSTMGTKALLHNDPRTFLTHYRVDTGKELRPLIRGVERRFEAKVT